MAAQVLYLDSFDTYGTSDFVQQGWTVFNGTTISTAKSRNGTQSAFLSYQDNMRRAFNSMQAKTVGIGCALYCGSGLSDAGVITGFTGVDANNSNIGFYINANGTVRVARFYLVSNYNPAGETTLGTSTEAITFNSWNHFEFLVGIDNSAGWYELYLNNVLILSGTNVDTLYFSSLVDTVAFFNPSSSGMYVDDLVIRGSTVLESMAPLGDKKVLARAVQGAGTYTDLTPSAGSNWDCVDEWPPSTTDYVSSATDGHKDSYDFAALADAGAISAVQVRYLCQKTEVGGMTLAPFVKSNTTTSEETGQGVSTDWRERHHVWELDPHTSAAWTQTNLDAAEFGFVVRPV